VAGEHWNIAGATSQKQAAHFKALARIAGMKLRAVLWINTLKKRLAHIYFLTQTKLQGS